MKKLTKFYALSFFVVGCMHAQANSLENYSSGTLFVEATKNFAKEIKHGAQALVKKCVQIKNTDAAKVSAVIAVCVCTQLIANASKDRVVSTYPNE